MTMQMKRYESKDSCSDDTARDNGVGSKYRAGWMKVPSVKELQNVAEYYLIFSN